MANETRFRQWSWSMNININLKTRQIKEEIHAGLRMEC